MTASSQRRVHGPVRSGRILAEAARLTTGRHCLVVKGRRSFDASGVVDVLGQHDGLDTRFVEIDAALPTAEAYQDLADAAAPFGPPDVVVAVGGGKILDLSKLLALQFGDAKDLIAAIRDKSRPRGKVPLVAVPTTAGSGAESTPFSVLYVDHVKWSVDMPELLPDCAVIDSRFAYTAGRITLFAAGLDCICQCLESLTARCATNRSAILARRGLSLAATSLVAAVEGDIRARRRLSLASNLAGRAIAVTRTTVPHALSYGLTSRHGVPHGIAVATTMGPYLEWVERTCRDQATGSPPGGGRQLACERIGQFRAVWVDIVAGLPSDLARTIETLRRRHGREMVETVNPERLANAVLPVTRDELRRMTSR